MSLNFNFLPPSKFILLEDSRLNELFGDKNKGIPFGTITEIIGESQTGKSSFLFYLIKLLQEKDLYSILFVTDFSFNYSIFNKFNIDERFLIICKINNLNQIFDIAFDIINNSNNTIHFIWIDSLSSAYLPDNSKIGDFSNTSLEINKAKFLDLNLPYIKKQLLLNNISLFFITYPKTNLNSSSIIVKTECNSLSLISDIRVLFSINNVSINIRNISNKLGNPFCSYSFNDIL